MHRLRWMLLPALMVAFVAGCGEDQPNPPAAASETNADFSKKTADMMKNANTGMDLKKAKAEAASAPK